MNLRILMLFLLVFYMPVFSWVYGSRDFTNQDDIPTSITARDLHGPLGKNQNSYNWTFYANSEISNFGSLEYVNSILTKASPKNYVNSESVPDFIDVKIASNYTANQKPGRDGYCAIVYGKPHPNALSSPGVCFNFCVNTDNNVNWYFSEFDIVITDFSYDNLCIGQSWRDKKIEDIFAYTNGNKDDGKCKTEGYDRESVLFHELGHGVGLDHPSTSVLNIAASDAVPLRFVMEPSLPWTKSKYLGTVDDIIEFNPNVKKINDEDCSYLKNGTNSDLYFGDNKPYNDFAKGVIGIYKDTFSDYSNSDFWNDQKIWWSNNSGLYCTNVWTDYPHVPGGTSPVNLTAINKGNRLTWLIENDAELYKILGFNIYAGQPTPENRVNPSLIQNGIKKYREYNLSRTNIDQTYLLEVAYRDGSSEIVPFER